jgi:hypothetical protein
MSKAERQGRVNTILWIEIIVAVVVIGVTVWSVAVAFAAPHALDLQPIGAPSICPPTPNDVRCAEIVQPPDTVIVIVPAKRPEMKVIVNPDGSVNIVPR